MGWNPCFKAFSYPLNDLKKGIVTIKQYLLKWKRKWMNRFLFNFLLFEKIHKYLKIQYQGEIVYFYKPNPQKYVSNKFLLPF